MVQLLLKKKTNGGFLGRRAKRILQHNSKESCDHDSDQKTYAYWKT